MVKELNELAARDDQPDIEDDDGNLHSLFFFPENCARDLDCFDWQNLNIAELRKMTYFS